MKRDRAEDVVTSTEPQCGAGGGKGKHIGWDSVELVKKVSTTELQQTYTAML
jgi:hypothetical protein